jgi:O-antigen/teichoic acid export membrane protein
MAKVAKRRHLLVARAGSVIEGVGFRLSGRGVKGLVTSVYRDSGSIRWLGKGFWAVADQGLFAASNFVLSVLLARWLSPQDYGAFAAAFAVFLFVGTLHTGLLTEPMLVFGSGRYKERLSEYLGTLLYGHAVFGLLSGCALLLASLGVALLGLRGLSTVILALAFTGPFILVLWLMRRASYARLQPRLATLGGALYMVLMLVGT